ncbi:MAG TPA: hypothetical protein VGE67_09165, partial [Haloferula sp.]
NGSATGTGAVTVAAGATLGGEGRVTGAVTAAGTIAPGGVTNAQGFLGLGATTLTGTYACQADGLVWDEISVTGNLVLTGSTLALSPVGAGFTETSYKIASWTGTRTGIFNVTGLPAGYKVVYDNSSKEIRLEVGTATPYEEYEASNGIIGEGSETDSDKDGISNGLEFALGGISDPSQQRNSTALLPTVEDLGASIRFSFHLTNDAAAITPAVWSVEFSDALEGTWTTAEDPANSTIAITPGGTSPESGEAWSLVQVTIPKATAKRFARLRVELP